jgi:hypothetical protein
VYLLEEVARNQHELLRRTHDMALDLTKLNAAVAAVEAKLAELKSAPPVTDPADQQAVDAVADKLAADAAAS